MIAGIGRPDRQAGQVELVVAAPDWQAGGIGFFEQWHLLLLEGDAARAWAALGLSCMLVCMRAARRDSRGERRGRFEAGQVERRVVFLVSHLPHMAQKQKPGSVSRAFGSNLVAGTGFASFPVSPL